MTPDQRKRVLWVIVAVNLAMLLGLLFWPLQCPLCEGTGKIEVSRRLKYSAPCEYCGGRRRLTIGQWLLVQTGVLDPVNAKR